jgi:conjugal transfer ATP-binding protein TraC
MNINKLAHRTFPDVFDETLPSTNANWWMSGSSGAGKSVITEIIARQVLDSGGFLSIKDIGDSYKAFCNSAGGTYINGSTLKFNPFANITDDTFPRMAERVCEQLCILASPNGQLDELHESLIHECIIDSWPHYQQDMRIDHVVDYLERRQRDVGQQHSVRMAGKNDEIITQLNKYTTHGIYGAYFNNSEPTLKRNEQFVVTEMYDLRKQSDLLAAGLLSMMLWTENLIYSTLPHQLKMDVSDGCWNMVSCISEKIGVFIERAHRVARRRNGSYGTVAQSLRDKKLNAAMLATYNNSAFKFTLMQDPYGFRKFRQEEPEVFSELEWRLVESFYPPRKAGYSDFLLSIDMYSSLHRIWLDPENGITTCGKTLEEEDDPNEVLFKMAQHYPHLREVLGHLRRMEV